MAKTPPTRPKTVAVICARIGSKGLPKKNLRYIAGKPLIAHSIEAARTSGVCDVVLVSTDAEELATVARQFGAEVIIRPADLGGDMIPAEPVVKHAVETYETEHRVKFDIVVYLQTTDLFRSQGVIAECVNRLAANPHLDSVFSGYKTHKNFWRKTPEGFVRVWRPDLTYASRQVAEPLYREDTGVACATRASLVREGRRIGPRVDIVDTEDFRTSIDIHTYFDHWLADRVLTEWHDQPAPADLRASPGGVVTRDIRAAGAAWLGEDVKSWGQSIRNGYIRAFMLFALHETGVFEYIRQRGPCTAADLARECDLNEYLLESSLTFLAHADQVLEKNGDRFALTATGREFLFADPILAMSFGAVGAYSSLLYNLVDTLREDKKYGVDFVRPGDLIAKGSFYTGKANYPWVVSKLSQLGVKTVADLGCGSADVLIAFCKQDPSLRGVGVDISPKALEEASRRTHAHGLERRIRLVEGDMTDPSTYAKEMEGVGAFNAIMSLHEFRRDGDAEVVRILREMKNQFPGRYLLVGEFNRMTDKDVEAIPYPDRIHPLFYQEIIHPHTWQGLPTTKENWLRIFSEAGLEVLEVKEDFPFRLVEYVLRF